MSDHSFNHCAKVQYCSVNILHYNVVYIPVTKQQYLIWMDAIKHYYHID